MSIHYLNEIKQENKIALEDENKKSIQESGIVEKHALKIAELAKRKKIFILFRPVNKDATALIEANYSTKGLHIKPKSSDWGPQSGFICTDSELSKCYGNKKEIENNAKNILHAIDPKEQDAIEVPLLISAERVNQLLTKKMFNVNRQQGPSHNRCENYIGQRLNGKKNAAEVIQDYVFSLVPLPNLLNSENTESTIKSKLFRLGSLGIEAINLYAKYKYLLEVQFEKIKGMNLNNFSYLVFYRKTNEHNYRPLMVLAKLPTILKKTKKIYSLNEKIVGTIYNNKEGGFLPVTADYDLFSIFPHISNFRDNYRQNLLNLKFSATPNITKNKLKMNAAFESIKQSLATRERSHVDIDLGRISTFINETKFLINEAARECGYKGGDVVQHGAEVDNLSVPNLDFPITVFTPAGRILSCKNKESLQVLFREMKELGYAVYINRVWVDANSTNKEHVKGRLGEKGIPIIEWNSKIEENSITMLLEESKHKP